jgi:Outer membrane protein
LILGAHLNSFAKNKNINTYGIINMQKVILTVKEGQEARKNLEKEFKKKQEDLVKQKTELDALNKQWQGQASLLSEKAKLEKQQEFQEKFMSFRNSEMQFQNELKQKEAQATQKIAAKAAAMTEKIAKKEGLKVVFESNSSGLIYIENPVDLTDNLIKEYDEKNPVVLSSVKQENKSKG